MTDRIDTLCAFLRTTNTDDKSTDEVVEFCRDKVPDATIDDIKTALRVTAEESLDEEEQLERYGRARSRQHECMTDKEISALAKRVADLVWDDPRRPDGSHGRIVEADPRTDEEVFGEERLELPASGRHIGRVATLPDGSQRVLPPLYNRYWLDDLNHALEMADFRTAGAMRWRCRASLKEADSRAVMHEAMTECRNKADELRSIAERLDAGAEHMAQLMRNTRDTN